MRKGPGSVCDKRNISVVIVTQIFHNGQPSHGGDRNTLEVRTSTEPIGTLDSVASLLEAALYQGNPDTFFHNRLGREHLIMYGNRFNELKHVNG